MCRCGQEHHKVDVVVTGSIGRRPSRAPLHRFLRALSRDLHRSLRGPSLNLRPLAIQKREVCGSKPPVPMREALFRKREATLGNHVSRVSVIYYSGLEAIDGASTRSQDVRMPGSCGATVTSRPPRQAISRVTGKGRAWLPRRQRRGSKFEARERRARRRP